MVQYTTTLHLILAFQFCIHSFDVGFSFNLELEERKIIVSHLILSPAGTKFIKILEAIVIIFHLLRAF